MIKVLIVDDHPFFREGVKLFLNSAGGFEIAGSLSDGKKAVEFLTSNKVDVVVMDLHMPGLDGISATRTLLEQDPSLRILILTSFSGGEKIQEALASGAAGYCLKDAPPAELAAAIRAVAEGGTYLGRGITPAALVPTNASISQPTTQNRAVTGISSLTERELEVLKLLTRGLGNKEIAAELYLGEKTVKTHVANILQKLEVSTRTQAALLASRQGLF